MRPVSESSFDEYKELECPPSKLDCLGKNVMIVNALEKILEKQDDDWKKRLEKSWYYLGTGKWVQYAALDARQAIHVSLDEALEMDSLDPILLAVARARSVFFENYDDDESFGSATFLEILRDILVLQAELGQKSQYTFEQLESMRIDPSF